MFIFTCLFYMYVKYMEKIIYKKSQASDNMPPPAYWKLSLREAQWGLASPRAALCTGAWKPNLVVFFILRSCSR